MAANIDLLASEYGWKPREIMELPMDQTAQLIHAILSRRGARVFRKAPQVDNAQPRLADRVSEIFSRRIDNSD